jgi:acetyltransferase-like isoleucine patch superfamily enzyme
VQRIAASARISQLADLEDSVRGSQLIVGENVLIDSFVKVVFSGGTGDVVIGDWCYINSGCVLYSGNGITLGRDVLLAANCVLAPTDHEYARRDIPVRLQGFRPSRGGIVVEDDVWVGAGSVLLDGTTLRRGAVVAAGSVVRGEVEPFTIVAGNRAVVVGIRSPERGDRP